jgi:hypothetical protein
MTSRSAARSRRAAVLIASLAALGAAFPALGEEASGTGILTLVVENDNFYRRTDGSYTSGVALVWAPAKDPAPGWALGFARRLPWFPEDGRVLHGYVLGQNIYTPRDITLADPPLDDRPYAGWLYGSIGLGIEKGRQLDQLALTLGIVGPASLAEQAQKFGHDLTHSPKPRGWDTQLGNELGVVLTYQRSWRAVAAATLAGLDFDLTPHFGGALGNVYTYLNGGMTLRVGRRLALGYGPPRVQPGIAGSGFFAPRDGFTWYLFAGVEARAVARNIFLDGNTFRDSRSVDKEPLVGDFQWGVALARRDLRLTYTHVRRAREFETQRKGDEFASVSLSMSF